MPARMNVFIDDRFAETYRRFPLVLVDIGARGGLRKNWRAAAPFLHYVGFEPEADEFARLAAGNARPGRTVLNVALHNAAGRIRLHVAREGGLSSIFEPDRAFLDAFPQAARWDIVSTREVEADTLDHQITAAGIPAPDFIKVDTQGSELFILQGAEHALAASLVGVEVEVAFSAMYKDQPYFGDVDRVLRERGYVLFDLRPCYWKRTAGQSLGGPRGQIVWGDALYFRPSAALRPAVDALAPAEGRAKVLKAISIALLYGYADLALETAQAFRTTLGHDAVALVEERLRAASPGDRWIPGQRVLASLSQRLWRLTRRRAQGWSVSKAELGNLD